MKDKLDKTQACPEALNFEAALTQLEAIVKKMETGELSLEASLQNFQEGIELSRNCQSSLKNAEQKVQMLTEKNGTLQSEPFLPDLPEE